MKTSFTLFCADKAIGEGEWKFRQHNNGMNVIDPDGRVVGWFAHEKAHERFDLPSFWRSIKHIQFTTDKGAVIQFEPDRRDVAIVTQYLDDALLTGGVASLNAYRNRALLSLGGGLGLAVLCLGLVFAMDQVMQMEERQKKNFGRPLIFGVIAGVALFAWGTYSLFRWVRLLRRANAEAADAQASRDNS